MSGQLVILSGPSGVGKDTIIDAWTKVNSRVERVVATTTRRPRNGEREGLDYHFVSAEEFQELASKDEFLEHKEVHGNWYATPKASVTRLLDQGKIAVLKIDVQGALEVMALRPDAISFFLLPPDSQALEERIRRRGADDEETIRLRLETARDEIALAHCYKHQLVNETVDDCVTGLEAICTAQEHAD